MNANQEGYEFNHPATPTGRARTAYYMHTYTAKTVKNGLKLNLYVGRDIKRSLFAMATDRRTSISAVVRDLVLAAQKPEIKEAA